MLDHFFFLAVQGVLRALPLIVILDPVMSRLQLPIRLVVTSHLRRVAGVGLGRLNGTFTLIPHLHDKFKFYIYNAFT